MKPKPSVADMQEEKTPRSQRASKPSMEAPTENSGGSASGNAERTAKAASRVVEDSERNRMIETAAYYRAEKRGFGSGHELDDWLEAEQEIQQQLRRH